MIQSLEFFDNKSSHLIKLKFRFRIHKIYEYFNCYLCLVGIDWRRH